MDAAGPNWISLESHKLLVYSEKNTFNRQNIMALGKILLISTEVSKKSYHGNLKDPITFATDSYFAISYFPYSV